MLQYLPIWKEANFKVEFLEIQCHLVDCTKTAVVRAQAESHDAILSAVGKSDE